MKPIIGIVVLLAWSLAASADDGKFSSHLHAKFQSKGCTNCHDFFEKKLGGRAFKSHQGRAPDMCVLCHTREVTGFEHVDEWFARPDLYTSGMDARTTCEKVKKSLNAQFKHKDLLARQLETHLFEDPRILWAIEGATPKSGQRPDGTKEPGLVKGGLTEWKDQVRAWIQGGMKCE